ncbi:hypothetical protein [Pollutibacter soli]|uniref:hypothetical protein n=1 Tax=Pollutibacter soli TaxID=3034157 RepID=UPI003013A33C
MQAATDDTRIAELTYLVEKASHLCDSIHAAIQNYPYYKTQLRNLKNKTLKQLESLSFQSGIEGFGFGWFSIGYKVNRNAFKLFYPAQLVDQQIADTSFVTHELKLQWSYYRWRPVNFQSFFADCGIAFGYSDNFTKLKKEEISETTEFGTSPGNRKTTKNYTAYKGEYLQDLKKVTLYGDIFWFLFQNNIAAFHVNPEWIIQSKQKPIVNTYLGFLFAIKDSKKESSVVNAELYYKFLDFFKTTETEYDLFERNNIGIRFSFPIQFKYK